MILRMIDGARMREVDLNSTHESFEFYNVIIRKTLGDWGFITKSGSVMSQGNMVSNGTFHGDDVYWISNHNHILIMVIDKPMMSGFSIPIEGRVTFGRQSDNHIVLRNGIISRKHGYFFAENNAIYVVDAGSTHGIYIDNQRITPNTATRIEAGSVVVVGRYYFKLDRTLKLVGSDDTVSTELRVNNSQENESLDYPWFSRAPRMLVEPTPISVRIESAPEIQGKPGFGGMGIVLSPQLLAMSLGMKAVRYAIGRKKYSKQEQARVELYGNYLAGIEAKLDSYNKAQCEFKNRLYPSVNECIARVEKREITLWERQPSDVDFMSVRLGEGTEQTNALVTVPDRRLSLQEDEFEKLPEQIKEKYSLVDNVPITVNLVSEGSCGLVGSKNAVNSVAKSMIVQLCALHSYTDLKIVVLFDKSEMKEWLWTRFLPHCFSKQRDIRYIAYDKDSAEPVLGRIDKEIKKRIDSQNQWSFTNNSAGNIPHYLFIVANPSLLDQTIAGSILAKNDMSCGVSAVILAQTVSEIPHSISNVINIRNDGGLIRFAKYNSPNDYLIFSQRIDDNSLYDYYARKLAPIRLSDIVENEEKGVPSEISLFDGLGIKKIDDVNALEFWREARPERSLKVPIGIKSGGDIYYFDIHEKKQGPHGLIAGGTGSGKSKMIQTWIATMALQYSPEDINFVLVDFKGESLIEPFRELPHLACTTHDNDPDVCRKLLSIESEIGRRERILSRYQCDDIITYFKKRRENPEMEPLPYLFFIVDEYAAFKAEYPEFTQPLERLFQQGRSLGFFAIVMTQSPSGKVTTQMNTNLGFRWCLRVDEGSTDSKEMLGTEDATHIRIPGRCYVKAKDGTYELIQAFYGHAKYSPDRKEKQYDCNVYPIRMNGTTNATSHGMDDYEEDNANKQLWVLSNYLKKVAERYGISKAKPIWQEALPEKVELESVLGHSKEAGLYASIGIFDSPAHQQQEALVHNFYKDSGIAVYGMPKSGKTTFLQSIILSLIMQYNPEQVQFYMLECGGFTLRGMEKFPHVGAAAGDDEPDIINKIIDVLLDILERRKRLFREFGVGDFETYLEISEETMPAIVFVVDHVNDLCQQFFDLKEKIQKIAGEGQSKGIFFICSVDGTSGLDMKLSQKIRTRYVLRIADKSDYISIIGKVSDSVDNMPIGRGFFKCDEEVIAFQTAILGVGLSAVDRIRKLRSLAEDAINNWNGSVPTKIFTLPDRIYRDEISDGRKGIIGLDTSDGNAVIMPEESGIGAMVSIAGQNITDRFIINYINEYSDVVNAKVYYVGNNANRMQSATLPLNVSTYTIGDLDQHIDIIADELRSRQQRLKQNSEEQFDPLIIVVSELLDLISTAQEMTILRLEAFIRLGKGLSFKFVAIDDPQRMNQCYHMNNNLLIGTLKKETRLIVGGNLVAHQLISAMELNGLKLSSLAEDIGIYLKSSADKPVVVKLLDE